jgi:chemotaxis protein MotA
MVSALRTLGDGADENPAGLGLRLMDIATGVGILAGIATICSLIIIDGGNFAAYYDKHAIIIIFGGAAAATMVRFPFGVIAHGLPMGLRFAFTLRAIHPRELIDEITRVAEIARKSGPVALESVEVSDTFLAQGLRYIADGYDKDFIRDTMERDRDNFLQRLDEGSKVYRAIGDCAPAWGMIGTIIGMVAMFANMSDPSKLGPAMATALLATLYGALIANMITLPIADKLHIKLEEEEISRTLIIDGVLQMRDAKSPTLVREMLLAYLPDHHRSEMAEAS